MKEDETISSDNLSALNQSLNRFNQSLKDNNKITRKNALESMKKQLVENFKPSVDIKFTDESIHVVFKWTLNLWNDPIEKCRELSVEIVKQILENYQNWDDEMSSSLIMSLFQRLAGKEVKESSEEIRLQLLTLMKEMIDLKSVENKKSVFEVHLNELTLILVNSLNDNFPEAKKMGCACAKLLAKSLYKLNFHMQSETLVKPLLANMLHQHSKVRKEIIDCLCDVVMYGNNKSVGDTIPHLAQRLFDQANVVRAAVIKLTGTWLLDLPDRYSFHHRLIPLLLTGFTDESIEIKELTESLWWDVGIKYEKENEQDLKDKSDFLDREIPNYPSECK